MTREAEALFALIRSALGVEENSSNGELLRGLSEEDWKKLIDHAFEQGVAAIAVDGLQKSLELSAESLELPLDSPELEDLKYEWFGSVFQAEEDFYHRKDVLKQLASFYSSHGIKMMLLKGYGLSLNYPIPAHRPVGDIDIYLFGKGEEGDRLLIGYEKCNVQLNPEKHSTFIWDGEYVENHARLIDDIAHSSLKEIERLFEEESENVTVHNFPEGDGCSIFFPSAMTNALFIPLHLAGHFVHGGASIRQFCDWATFVMRNSSDIDWNKVEIMSKEAGFFKFFCIINGITKSYLGVPSALLPEWPRNEELEKKVISDIFNPRAVGENPSLVKKVIRFFGKRWKYDLVFKESIFHSFIFRAKAYLILHDTNANSIWKREKKRRQWEQKD